MEAASQLFLKLGLRGATVLVASGDQGVWGREGAFGAKGFHPDFPASSPYVTAVGGTDFATKNVIGDERAWSDGGGGFSDYFGAPKWQGAAVKAYLGGGTPLPNASYFNATGRGYPDVSALGGQQNPYCVSVNFLLVGVAGTSASCPVVAGVVAKLNELRLAAGKPAMVRPARACRPPRARRAPAARSEPSLRARRAVALPPAAALAPPFRRVSSTPSCTPTLRRSTT